MHYANGRVAKVGDLVRGKGYNVKYEITGLLVQANPGATSCNCTVAYVGAGSQLMAPGWRDNTGTFTFQTGMPQVIASHEYGQLDAFNAINPSTGEVLPPEGA